MAANNSRVTDLYKLKKRTHGFKKELGEKPSTSKSLKNKPALKNVEVLKKFDMTWEYGPCIGISRMERWKRAERHGLNPPTEVKDIISKHENDKEYTECVWSCYSTLN
ncbi:DNA polymerase delta subunit 4-like [Physella acuta]|uniref:DNA polymerase delta subunit 4-like n=1 Tax=Physella acuta TaxID=109671 RepID=UPI0027DB5C28|nr:DNA polymerase delta subunit 4-like [Physella acuta]XP_059165932.1 DNA polymerase delta subunit 4-like [Physella acuta]